MADDETPGWDAIDRALVRVYRDQEPKHYGTVMKWSIGGSDPLDGVSIYRSTAFGAPHWHYVSYGLTELYEKESETAEVSGWGFELTFRLARTEDDAEPPIWPINFMQNLARYVFDSGLTLDPGDHMSANGPIARDAATALSGVLFVEDPELPRQETPNGTMQFVQIVAVTADELASAQSWNTRGMLDLLAKEAPGWVTDLSRTTTLAKPDVAAAIERGIREEGSSMGVAFGDRLAFERTSDADGERFELTLGAIAVEQLVTVVPGRLRFGRPLLLVGKDDGGERAVLELVAGDAVTLREGGERPVLSLPAAVVTAFAERVRARPGRYELGDALTVRVVAARPDGDRAATNAPD